MDSTHLRFFVEQTAVELVNSADLRVTKGIVTGLDGPRSNLLDRLSLVCCDTIWQSNMSCAAN